MPTRLRLSIAILLSGLSLGAMAFGAGGDAAGIGALAGVVTALVHLHLTDFVWRGIAARSRGRAPGALVLGTVYVGKLLALFALVWAALRLAGGEAPVTAGAGFVAGFSSLWVGMLLLAARDHAERAHGGTNGDGSALGDDNHVEAAYV